MESNRTGHLSLKRDSQGEALSSPPFQWRAQLAHFPTFSHDRDSQIIIMFNETPDASIEEIFEAMPFVSGRLRLVQDEIVRRLGRNLPLVIAELNARNRWTGIASKEIPVPIRFGSAPSVLTDEFLNAVLVSVSLESSPQGIGSFKNEVQVAVYCIDSRINTAQQLTVHWERAELVRGVLFPFLTGCVNAEGQRCWRQLQPTSIELLPDEWNTDYSGTTCRFVALQAPGNGESWS